MRKLVPVVLALGLLASAAMAQTTAYTYTGAPYTSASAPYTLGGNVTGTFTTANPLPAFLPLTDIRPSLVTASFNDDVATRTLANSFVCTFEVATDGVGNITQWQITLRESPYAPATPQHAIDSSGQPGVIQGSDLAGTGPAGANPCDPIVLSPSAASSVQGSWSDSFNQPSQPTTYTYTGAPYTTASGPYSLGQNVTGTITTANPLPPFLPLTDIRTAVTSLSFNDDVVTRTLANSFVCSLEVATDGAGNITRWAITLRESPYTTGNPQHSLESNGQPGVIGGSDLAGSGLAGPGPCDPFALTTSASSSAQGSWTDTNPLASQPTTYTYTGDPYTSASAPYSIGGNLTGTITTANPLPPFLPLTDITAAMTSLSFNDDVEVRTLANSFLCAVRVATDGAGNITRWQIALRRSPYTPATPQHSINTSGQPGVIEGADLVGTGTAGAGPCDSTTLSPSAVAATQGTWTDTNPLTTQPTTYHYQGDRFTTASGPYTAGERVTGSITTANPLPPFLPLTDITDALVSMSFNDSVVTRTLSNSFVCSFRVATDGQGRITQWQLTLRESPYTSGNPQHSIDSSGNPGAIEGSDLAGTGFAGVNPCSPIALTTSGSSPTQGAWFAEQANESIPTLDGVGLLALSLLLTMAALLAQRAS